MYIDKSVRGACALFGSLCFHVSLSLVASMTILKGVGCVRWDQKIQACTYPAHTRIGKGEHINCTCAHNLPISDTGCTRDTWVISAHHRKHKEISFFCQYAGQHIFRCRFPSFFSSLDCTPLHNVGQRSDFSTATWHTRKNNQQPFEFHVSCGDFVLNPLTRLLCTCSSVAKVFAVY